MDQILKQCKGKNAKDSDWILEPAYVEALVNADGTVIRANQGGGTTMSSDRMG
jgi:hypothetical protein